MAMAMAMVMTTIMVMTAVMVMAMTMVAILCFLCSPPGIRRALLNILILYCE